MASVLISPLRAVRFRSPAILTAALLNASAVISAEPALSDAVVTSPELSITSELDALILPASNTPVASVMSLWLSRSRTTASPPVAISIRNAALMLPARSVAASTMVVAPAIFPSRVSAVLKIVTISAVISPVLTEPVLLTPNPSTVATLPALTSAARISINKSALRSPACTLPAPALIASILPL